MVPSPRAGHAGAVTGGRYWCIVGGGNNQNGVPDTALLDLELMRWLDVGGSKARAAAGGGRGGSGDGSRGGGGAAESLGDGGAAFPAPAVVGEGMSLCAVEVAGGDAVLVAFGGYNGACQQEVQAFRVPPDFPFSALPSSVVDAASPSPSPSRSRSPSRSPRPSSPPTKASALSEAPATAPGAIDAPAAAAAAAAVTSVEASKSASDSSPPSDELAMATENARLRAENAALREHAGHVNPLGFWVKG